MPDEIHKSAKIPDDLKIGKHCVIGENVEVGPGCLIGHNVVIHPNTKIGSNVRIDDNTVLGKLPMKAANSAVTKEQQLPGLVIGDNCIIGKGKAVVIAP